MDTNGYIKAVVGALIAAIVAVAVVLPIFAGAEDSVNVTYTNDDTYRMSPVGDDTVVISYASDVWTINGVEYARATMPISQNDTYMIYGVTGTRAAYTYSVTGDGYTRSGVQSTVEFTVTYNGSDKTIVAISVVGDQTYSKELTYTNEVYYLDAAGSYVWKSELTDNTYVNDEWPQFNCWSSGDTDFYSVMDGVVTHNGVVVEDPEITITKDSINSYRGVYELSAYSITYDDTTVDCRGYILPLEVTGTINIDSTAVLVVQILPVILMVAVLMGILGVLVMNRRA